MRTIKEWLETIEDEDTRKRALAHHESQKDVNPYVRSESPHMAGAILFGFTWSNTPEGELYWDEVYTPFYDQAVANMHCSKEVDQTPIPYSELDGE